MSVGICTVPLLPIRIEPSERSEMNTQLLFGELFEVLEEKDSWSRIRNITDNYLGWGTSKMMQKLPSDIFKELVASKPFFTQAIITPCIRKDERTPQLFIPAGSRLYDLNKTSGFFPVFHSKTGISDVIEKDTWNIKQSILDEALDSDLTSGNVVKFALRFLNAPYLWGGKSILGIDCSGLVQLVFSIFGFDLPRDARDQLLVGDPVPDLSLVQPADLAFFANSEGMVVHVGILLDPNHIIHASGNVHIDSIDNNGIFSEPLGRYTHSLYAIRRHPNVRV